MPTLKPRHMITETDDIAAALEVAARRWPEDKDRPGRLIVHLIDEGTRVVRREQADIVADRLALVDELAGSLTGVYHGPNAISLEQLRDEWPE